MSNYYNTLSTNFTQASIDAVKKRKLVVFLDPGHGGVDPGAVGRRSKEADNVLRVALKLAVILRAQGYIVHMSRTTDVFIGLGQRAVMANNVRADIFISLHDNSATNPAATGFETFIFNNFSNTTSRNNAQKLQNCIHGEIARDIGLRDRGKKAANFQVLRDTNMTAILIEYGFINNPNVDEPVIADDINRQAWLTYQGINKYFGIPVKLQEVKKEVKPVEVKKGYQSIEGSHASAWKAMYELGIMNGENPNGPITRAQMATVIDRVMNPEKRTKNPPIK